MSDEKIFSGAKLSSCSFCGKSRDDVKKLVAGSAAFICSECIGVCNGIMKSEDAGTTVINMVDAVALRKVYEADSH